ncbi:MAG: peptide deformylase [Vampirovibrio sp.]|nr:peptide deformylase [Vampirovibrio sp.]
MTVLKIYKYPHPVLRAKCETVTNFEDPTFRQFVQDMEDTMYDCTGAVGLASPQVGNPIRMVLIDVTASGDKTAKKFLVNPEIVQKSKNKNVREGCLSFPEYLANVKRAMKVTVVCQDEHGNNQEYQVEGLEAIAVQHELDHLDGVLMIDRVNSLKTDWIRRQGPSSQG